ncbi:MAG: glycosyltransferase [Deltaproteobacteria bacterium]|nr:glycosyltransferase [Deltaproteobacteria bacterium]
MKSPSAKRKPGQELSEAWQEHFRKAAFAHPAHPGARDFLERDLRDTLARWIPQDASVLDVGCGTGELLVALPNPERVGIAWPAEVADEARRRHPELAVAAAEIEGYEPGRRFDAVICNRLCHSVTDIRAMLACLREHVSERGRLFLVVYNYLWEVPSRLAELAGFKLPAPTSNWLSHSDFENLFAITGLEIVRFEDRMLLPAQVPGLTPLLNRYLGKLPGWQRLSMYRIYALRRRENPARPRKVSVSVVVPARNEAGNIAAAIARTPVMGAKTEIVFVEGGSRDGTWDAIQAAIGAYRGPLELAAYRQEGKGKGDAVRLGFAKAKGDVLMILDADLTVPPEDLPVFYDVIARGLGDYVQGTRLVYPMDPGAMRFFNKLGNMAFSQLFSYLLQQPIKDTLCGTKVLWRHDYERIAAGRGFFGDFDPFGDFDLIFGAAKLNLKIVEIPVRYRERVYGETNISRWKHGWLLLKMSGVAARKLRYV